MRHQVIGRSIGVIALLAATAATMSAQDAKVTEILTASRKAIGEKNVDALKTLSVQATMQRNLGNFQTQSEVEMLIQMPDKYVRTDTSSGPMTMALRTGFNGDRAIMPRNMRVGPAGAMVFSMSVGGAAAAHGHGEEPTPEQLEQMNKGSLRNYRQEISRLMLGWFAMTHPAMNAQYSYVGEAESPDGKAYVVDVKDDDGFAARLFIDQNSKLPLMVTYQARQGRVMTSGGPGTVRAGGASGEQRQEARPLSDEEVKKRREEADKRLADLKTMAAQPAPMVEHTLFFDDWRQVDGINFPHVIRRAAQGATNEEWTISKVKVNPRIDEGKFRVETK